MSRSSLARVAAASGLTLGLALASATLAPAAHAAPAPAAPSAAPVVTPASVAAGPATTVTITGTGCTISGSTVPTTASAGVSFGEMGNGGQVQANTDGTWSINVKLPADLPAGSYPVMAKCLTYYGTDLFTYAAQSVTVTAPAAPVKTATVTKDAKGVVTVTAEPGQSLTPQGPVKVGQRLALRLTGYTPGETAKLVLHSTPRDMGTRTAGADGVLVTDFVAPAGTPAGEHTLKVTSADGTVRSYPVTISAEKLTAAELAATGADVTVPLVGGIALVLVGAGVTYVARRRPTGAAQA
ncbi:hypothetical protein GCU60_14395 [Blastococcus saxobsidens]|uniref:Uncharacterized protein n=1 Tax=Blastococcus saxobsidens TaxID=138336 RepID=A0A6L9W536_9ACTN|nr:hypothetical protein [Blastococcus saxobsidens]NEK86932.1 hypothetical protein [Blastococcus saxobsidens]